MDLERVTAVVRPRSPWEAVDLGFGLARAHWRAVWTAWAIGALPVLVAIWALLWTWPPLAILAAWLVQPLLGVLPLYAISRALFGAAPRAGELVRAWPGLWLKNLLPALILWRLDPMRSFRAPVWVLEGLRGRARRRRLEVIGKRHQLSALGLTVSCLLLQSCLSLALLLGLWLLLPVGRGVEWERLFEVLFGEGAWAGRLLIAAAHVGGLTIVEPCYVAAGFALYVNRRVQLEGWDLELSFRRLAARLRQQQAEAQETDRLARSTSSRRTAALGAALLAVWLGAPAPAAAQDRGPPPNPEAPDPAAPEAPAEGDADDPEKLAKEVLADPVFGGPRTQTRRVFNPRGCEPRRPPQPGGGGALAGGLSAFARLILIALVVVVLVGAVWAAVRVALSAAEGGGRGRVGPAPPQVLMGLDLRPESLPRDVPGHALRHWERGEHAAALSLLYRGALAGLIERLSLTLAASATEGDCVEAVRRARGPVPWFQDLTAAWQEVAYAGRVPADERVRALCAGYQAAVRAAPEAQA